MKPQPEEVSHTVCGYSLCTATVIAQIPGAVMVTVRAQHNGCPIKALIKARRRARRSLPVVERLGPHDEVLEVSH